VPVPLSQKTLNERKYTPITISNSFFLDEIVLVFEVDPAHMLGFIQLQKCTSMLIVISRMLLGANPRAKHM